MSLTSAGMSSSGEWALFTQTWDKIMKNISEHHTKSSPFIQRQTSYLEYHCKDSKDRSLPYCNSGPNSWGCVS